MNAKNRYLQLRSALLLRQNIWSKEVLHHYPEGLEDYPAEWLQELGNCSHYELWKIDARRPLKKSRPSAFYQHLEELDLLTQLPSKNYQPFIRLPSWAFSRVKEKKQHEISVLAQALNEMSSKRPIEKLVDIGGGLGHFARIMAHYFQQATMSVERDAQLQELGKQRVARHPAPVAAAELEFYLLDFQDHQSQESEMKPLFQNDYFSLGLHTCGPLAVRHLEAQVHFKARGLLNFGCCYGKILDPKDLQLSTVARDFPLELTPYALTLATRSHSEMSYENFCLKERVKYYRYALQLLLKKEFGVDHFITVGDSPLREYLTSFSQYAQKKIHHLQLSHTNDPSIWDKFYLSYEIQQNIRKMFYADIIRWQYGRALELIILMDRALFLEEHGHAVELAQYFDDKLSPRNIGLFAYLV